MKTGSLLIYRAMLVLFGVKTIAATAGRPQGISVIAVNILLTFIVIRISWADVYSIIVQTTSVICQPPRAFIVAVRTFITLIFEVTIMHQKIDWTRSQTDRDFSFANDVITCQSAPSWFSANANASNVN